MYTIGQFSRVTGLTVKSLRHYQKEGLIEPVYVDEATGYRYYDANLIERATVIGQLRRMDFSIETIREILGSCEEDADLVGWLDQHKEDLRQKIRHNQDIVRSLDEIINIQQEIAMNAKNANHQIEEKKVEPTLVAGVRMKGCYGECGKGFSKIGRALGRYITGKPMCLYYDDCYKEADADFEPCMPLKKDIQADGISVRQLPGGRCVSLVFQGPYGETSHHQTYQRIFDYIEQHEYTSQLPSREIFIKGPGMIFRGNPKKYLTEIQIFIELDEE